MMLNLLKTLSSHPSIHRLVNKVFQAIAQTILATPLNQIVLVGGGIIECPVCDAFSIDKLIRMSHQIVGTENDDMLIGFQVPGLETRPDYFLGYEGYDIFMLGDSEQAYYLEHPLALAIIGDFHVGEDQIQLYGDMDDYFLGTSSDENNTIIVHYETEEVVGLILGVTDVELGDDSIFSFV